jgi:putative lipoprotein
MKTQLLAALLGAGLFAGCSQQPPPPPPAAPTIASAITGTVMLAEPRELSNQARVELKVVDVKQPATPLAQIVIPSASRPPIQFTLPIDARQVDPKGIYAVDAVLVDGDRRYLPVLQSPVLTDAHHTSSVQIIVKAEATPAEKMFDAYRKAYSQVATMKQISGSSMGETSSTAWDAFLSNGKVHLVREITDLDNDKGRISVKMAFQNDKPWVVVKEESAAGSTRPFSTSKVGWDENGQLVLKERMANGQISEVSADEAKALYNQAQQSFNHAQANAPKK